MEGERLAAQAWATWEASLAEYERAERETGPPDYLAIEAAEYRSDWIATRSRSYRSFEDATRIPPMRFTDEPAPPPYAACITDALQVFSARVAAPGLRWPLDVFGIVAVRDNADYIRNAVFHRARESCQTLTEEDPYLELTGPTRAVVLDYVVIEAALKVRGATESDDRDLSFLAVPVMRQSVHLDSYLRCGMDFSSKLSTRQFRLAHIVYAVEATILVRVVGGSWRDGFRGLFAARTASIDGEEIVLLRSRDEGVVVADDGSVRLSRCVASVETEGELRVSVRASGGHTDSCGAVEDELAFVGRESGRSYGTLDVGFCRMGVTVAWSLISRRDPADL